MIHFRAPRFPEYVPLADFLSGSQRVAFLGATLGSLSGSGRPENAEVLRALAQSGVPMDFAIIDPDASAQVHDVLASWFGSTGEDVRNSLRKTVAFFLRLRASAGPYADRVAIHGLQTLPSSGVAMVDHDRLSIRARLTLYPMQGTPRYDPFLEGDLSTPTGRTLCDLCIQHYDRLVATSRDLSFGSDA